MDTNQNTKNSHKTRKNYSHAILDAWKTKLRDDAEDRQHSYNKLSTAQKLERAKKRVAQGLGECKKEIAKLTKRLEWEKAQKVTAQATKAATPETPSAPVEEKKAKTKRAKKSK